MADEDMTEPELATRGGTDRQNDGARAARPASDLPVSGPANEGLHAEERDHMTAPVIIGSSTPNAVTVMDDTPPVFGAGLSAMGGRRRIGDRVFAGLASGAGAVTVIVIALIAIFLIAKAAPAITSDHEFFLFSRGWSVDSATLNFGVVDLLWVTVLIAVIAMVIAVPIAIGIALFITQYAPKQLAKPVAYLVDLLAAVPSIIYGIWGIIVLAPHLKPVQSLLYHLHFIPLFGNKNVQTGTIFNAGVVLAIMILPIITAISRDVFERTPTTRVEAALALGATRWEMIRMAVLPYGRPGVISGAMLGLGRALGETIAITLILSGKGNGTPFSWSIFDGGATFASKIALAQSEFNEPKQTGPYIVAGLVLFLLTFAVNAAARYVVNRRREFA